MYILIFVFNYSIFSCNGLGEPILSYDAKTRSMGGIYNFYLPRFLTIEISMLNEVVNTYEKMQNYSFTLPYFRFTLPLPKNFVIDADIKELLNLNFDIESEWEQFGADSLRRIIKGRGSVSMAKFCIGLSRNIFSIEGGSFFVFGNLLEEWITDFVSIKDSYDTLILNFEGLGWSYSSSINLWKINLNTGFLSGSNLPLPRKITSSIILKITENFLLGSGIDYWEWSTPITKISFGSEFNYKNILVRSGFYNNNWYYGNIKEKVASFGLGFSFKSLCTIDLSFEYGKRSDGIIYEKIYRSCINLKGWEEI